MANEILYKSTRRKVFGSEKWVAAIVLKNTLSFDSVCSDVAKATTGQPGEVSGLLRAYLSRIRTHVLQGEAVKINGLGTFYPRLTTRMVTSQDQVSVANCVKNITIGFRPEQKLLRMVKASKLKEFTGKQNQWED